MVDSHPLVQLAKNTIERYVRDGETIQPPKDLPAEMQVPAGAFVTIHKHGRLRGCIGTIEPRETNLAEEVLQNAIAASTRDPRFPAITQDELTDLEIKVDVLSEPERVEGLEELDPKRYGVIVTSPTYRRRGLLLPDLEGVDTVDDQVDIARRKAGMMPDEAMELYRFEVMRYT
jgi:AmmeMemoRadiSam system protein A